MIFKGAEKLKERREGSSNNKKNDDVGEDESEKEFLERIRNEAELPEYSLFVDFAEMVTQFGYVVLWSVIWPLAPVWAFVNNFVELRSDAFKLCATSRRPVPVRTDTIGPWLDALGFLIWLGTLTNSSLIYLFRPHYTSTESIIGSSIITPLNSTSIPSEKAQFNNSSSSFASSSLSPRARAYSTSNVFIASQTPVSEDGVSSPFLAIRSTLFTALLIALASEHGYLIARYAVTHVIEKLLWSGSQAHLSIKRSNLLLKKSYLESRNKPIEGSDEALGEEAVIISNRGLSKKDKDETNEKLKREVQGIEETADEKFWNGPDRGLDEIRGMKKME